MILRDFMLALAAVTTSVLTAAALASEGSDASVPAPKAVTIAVAIGQIKKEAAEAWSKGGAWARGESSFAQDKNWSVPEGDVVRALTRRLHDEAPVDAYIKWQLLSFIGRLPAENAETLNRVTSSSPKPVPQPVVREEWLAVSTPGSSSLTIAQQRAYVQNLRPVVGNGAVGVGPVIGVVSSGTSVGLEASTQSYVTVVRGANEKLSAARQDVRRANEMILRYRDALAERMPAASGLSLAAAIKDLRERIEAAEPSSGPRIARLIHETEKLPEDVSPQTRRTLAGWIADTAKVRTQLIESISLDAGNRVVLHGRWIGIAEEDAKLLIERLGGDATLAEKLTRPLSGSKTAPPSP